jgi:hypothetical protein
MDKRYSEGEIAPIIKPQEAHLLASLSFSPKMVEIEVSESPPPSLEATLSDLASQLPDTILALRLPYVHRDRLFAYYDMGIKVFHLISDLHGRGPNNRFVIELIQDVHQAFVEAGVRDQITLIGSGGITAAEHVPKAIICGLDVVALDTPLLVALQTQFEGECADPQNSQFRLPANLSIPWGIQRIKNLTAAWHDQLLEILGAMGLREVRRLRGEIGRVMFQTDLEREAFAEIKGYD